MNKRKKNNLIKLALSLIAIVCIGIVGYLNPNFLECILTANNGNLVSEISLDLNSVPNYTSTPYVIINDNLPNFNQNDFTTNSFESYSSLDSLGRCGVAFANISLDTMPDENEERENISSIKPSGWINKKYDIVDGGYLYNRCHLIGYQLSAENANKKNLITGTRYMNTEGMLPFENKIAEYVKESGNHVLYRVTPIYKGENLVASGVQMEAESVEDNGKGICFNIYCYNVQPGITINYKTGNSKESV